MNIKNIIIVLFASLTSLLTVAQSMAQTTDTTLVYLGFDVETSSATGAATAADLSRYFAIDPSNALFGQIPGLTVLQNGGNWWSQGATLRVRGQANLSNTSAPLILIDGFERSISAITVQEIEKVTILKDASATALYGQRGANGVILVTTKRGLDEGMKVQFSNEYSVNQPFRMPQMLDAYGYATAMNEALALDGRDYRYSQEQLNAYKNGTFPDYYPNVNWFDEALRNTGYVNDINATFRGGRGKTRYFVALNHMSGEGLLKQDRNPYNYSSQLSYNRTNLRTNLDVELTRTTMMKFNLAGRISGFNRPGNVSPNNIFSLMYETPANAFPVKYEDGIWGGSAVYGRNVVAEINETGFASSHDRVFYADLTIIQDLNRVVDGLTLSAAASFDNELGYWDAKSKNYVYVSRTADIDEVNQNIYNIRSASFGERTDLAFSTSFAGQLRHANGIIRVNYDQQWDKHKLNAMVFFHAHNEIGLGANNTYHRINNAGHFHYVFDKKYFADLTMSYSGNNILPENNRFQFFPALSLGWMVSEESFMSGAEAINALKLRASAGWAGLEPSSWHLHRQMYGGGQNYFYGDNNASIQGRSETRRANPEVHPEKSFMSNFGVDALLFGRLRLNADAFYEKRSQILVSEANAISSVIGVGSTMVADGIVENKGVEIGALWNQRIGDFSYSLGAQYSFARNKIIEQNEVFREWDYLSRTGHPIGQMFGLQDNGFWGVNDGLNGENNSSPDGVEYTFTSVLKPGDVRYVDMNGNNIIDEFDMVPIGYSQLPEMYFSFSVGAAYKRVGINAVFQGVTNVSEMLNTNDIFWPLYNNRNISTFSNDRWTPATANTATLPRLTPEMNNNNYRASTVWLRDASYLKLRTLELFYILPSGVLEKVRLENARIFVRGMNLFSIDNIKIMDPEETGKVYPTLRSYNAGLSISF
jgi:TonB-linked SusC/RagA family outer membrane protein